MKLFAELVKALLAGKKVTCPMCNRTDTIVGPWTMREDPDRKKWQCSRCNLWIY